MGKKKWEVVLYENSHGQCPTEDFLSDLSKVDQKIVVYIQRALYRLEQYGSELRRPYVENLREKIWELRVKTHHGLFRFLYFFDDDNIVITHGFQKKSGDVPDLEIDKAIEYRKDHFTRKKKENRP